MRHVKPPSPKRKPSRRPYHPVDEELAEFDHECPDWLVGAH